MKEEDKKDIADIVNISVKAYFDEKETREKPKEKSGWIKFGVPMAEGAVLLYLLYQLSSYTNKF